ncbi:phosphate ABC transporter permease subunit PstC [Vibrio sp. SM6]|uniref:Phosphate transport system permease protein n=1 Tax=Vibrio agarilyticus TaxID=2726741 RepID=A0A7X8TNX9_9VIBR|nr:phosphate ABC transporter permease subunit PstC [Vibrio agarilyticus]NLS12014.1 phosphate ABC transporter permease subunit PstC [Vibrio agarilyticus]
MMIVLFALLALSSAFWGAQQRAKKVARGAGGVEQLGALPSYYGWYAFWLTLLPTAAIGLIASAVSPVVLKALTLSHFATLWSLADTGISAELLFAQISAIAQSAPLLEPAFKEQSAVLTLPEKWQMLPYREALVESALYYQSLRSQFDWGIALIVLLMLATLPAFALRQISPRFRARHHVEKVVRVLLLLCSLIAILTTLGIVLSVLFESIRFFQHIPLSEFLFGTHWSPQIALREDQHAASGAFGAVPLFVGTLLITLIAMCVAAPVGLLSAIYLAEYAPERARAYLKPLLEILAGVPTVVYGFFAALTIAPWIRRTAESFGVSSASSESALAAGLVMGVMIIPFVSSLADDVIRAVPQDLRNASLAMGATRSETIKQVVLPAALPGIVGGLLLAISRAIGETMIVVMAAGLSANLTANPLESVTTITVQIVTLLVGDQAFDSPKTLAAFALGLTLFVVTLLLNVVALHIVKRYRERYD